MAGAAVTSAARGGGGATRQTRPVPTFTIYVALRAAAALDDATVDDVAAGLRPGDGELRVWRESDRAVLRASDRVRRRRPRRGPRVRARAGRRVQERCPGDLLEAAALSDDDSLVWRAWL